MKKLLLAAACLVLALALFTGCSSEEEPTTVSIWFMGGMILFVLGIIGLYIGRIFNQVKERQIFIVKEALNVEGE